MDTLSRRTGDASRLVSPFVARSSRRTFIVALALVVSIAGWVPAAVAQDVPSVEQRPGLNADSVQQRLDRRVPALLDTHAVPGAV
ncbi:MAG TPA: hypothetical protein ACFCU0_04330, partial [Longibacter sp.]